MREGMFSSSSVDFYQCLLSFRDKIVGVELLHHVGPEILDRAQLRNEGPVR